MARHKNISKTEAVKQALDQLGLEVTPTQVRNFVKEQVGLDISLSHISNIKSALARGVPAAGRNGSAHHANGIRLQDLLTVQQLVQRHGAEVLHALIDLVSK